MRTIFAWILTIGIILGIGWCAVRIKRADDEYYTAMRRNSNWQILDHTPDGTLLMIRYKPTGKCFMAIATGLTNK